MVDVLIIGAGAAGLTAAGMLSRKGLSVEMLEARNRLGGRIHTIRSPHSTAPVEMGAEFIHGRPSEILDTGLPFYELDGEQYTDHGRQEFGFWRDVERILGGMDAVEPDLSFADYIGKLNESQEAKDHATRYVEGFNAADAERVSVQWLVQESKAEESIEGDRMFRLEQGYGSLIETLTPPNVLIHLRSIVSKVSWARGSVRVYTTHNEYAARTCIVTVPLGVLQAGRIEFALAIPKPEGLVMGEVIRVGLVFDEPFWEKRRRNAFFLFTDEGRFPTWWTTHPKSAPLLVGWAAGKCARPLIGLTADELERQALRSLCPLLDETEEALRRRLKGFYSHDWQSDPFSLGAYSYAETGGADASRKLATPLDNTLFFAGEATEWTGHSATVHGAMRSGVRVAEEILGVL